MIRAVKAPALLFFAIATFLLGVIAFAAARSLGLTLEPGIAELVDKGVLAATALGVVVFLGLFLEEAAARGR